MSLSLFDFLYGISAVLVLTLGIFTFFDNPKDKNRRLFFVYTIYVLGWMLSMYFGYVTADMHDYGFTLNLFRFSYGFSLLAMTYMTVFIYYFPNDYPIFKRPIKLIFILFSFVIFFLSISTSWIHNGLIFEGNNYVGDAFGPLYPLYTILIVINLAISIFISILKIKKTSGIEKNKIFLTFYGYILGVSITILINVILPLFGIFGLERYSVLFPLVFIISAYIAIQRYRFFHFSIFATNALRSVIILSAYSISSLIIYRLFNFAFSFNQNIQIITTLIISLYIYRYFDIWMPKMIPTTYKEFLSTISHLKTEIYHSDTFEKLQKNIEDSFILRLNFSIAKLYIVRDSHTKFHNDLNIFIRNDFTHEMQNCHMDVIVRDETNYTNCGHKAEKIFSDTLDALGCKICIPLFSEKTLIGFLALGENRSKSFMYGEAIKELSDLKKGLSISLMNILLKLNLQEENDLMKMIINKKTKLLKEQYKEIKTLLKQQSDFIAVTAHELRTPLNIALLKTVDIAESEKISKEAEKGLSVVSTSLTNLKDLVQKLFDVQQYDLNKVVLKLTKTDMSEFAQNIYNEMKPVMAAKKINFKFINNLKRHKFAKIDPSQIRQVINNLFGNSLKFTPERGLISLSISEKDNKIIIKVTDSGSGIPDIMKKKIFEKFQTKKGTGGLGLGLYLCKKIVEMHKGKIWADNIPEGGAVFSVSLPL